MTWRDREGCTGSKNGNPSAGGTCAGAARRRRLTREIMAFPNLLVVPLPGADFLGLDSLDGDARRDPRR
jgi:hypothetical protein